MREFTNTISINLNSRGCYSIDTVIGCIGKCFNDCYANRLSKAYGYNFRKYKPRYFKNIAHLHEQAIKYKKIKMPFLRIGTMGDPSLDWDNTLNAIQDLKNAIGTDLFGFNGVPIVIITKHWNSLTKSNLLSIDKNNICINTSVSCIDKDYKNKIETFISLGDYCKSVLRLVSFDFNKCNKNGLYYHSIQNEILNSFRCLETVFRPTSSNKLLKDGIIKTKKGLFCGKPQFMSKRCESIYTGICKECPDMCGISF